MTMYEKKEILHARFCAGGPIGFGGGFVCLLSLTFYGT